MLPYLLLSEVALSFLGVGVQEPQPSLGYMLAAAADDYPARVVAVGTDRTCAALDIAAAAEVPSYTVRLGDHADRAAWERLLPLYDATDRRRRLRQGRAMPV